jgi:GMP synthase (glutamine-hydrolysing)
MMEKNKIAVIDLGGQYAHLIAKEIRNLGAKSYVVNDTMRPRISKQTCGIILSGGPSSVYGKDSPKVTPSVFKAGIPILGICYGHHLMAHALGGSVTRGTVREYGVAFLDILTNNGLFKGLKSHQKVWMSHGDNISKMPHEFEVLGSTPDCEFAAIGDLKRKFFGLQFHPEVTHTPSGRRIFKNFVFNVCGCKVQRKSFSDIPRLINDIKRKAQNRKVFFLVSGGVDSTVAFSLCTKALGKERAQGLCVDTGLLRKNEVEEVKAAFKKMGMSNVEYLRESKTFVNALRGIHDPEEKRKIIGRKFVVVQNNYMKCHRIDENDWLLGQGTIYPDTIESGGTKHSSVIKTHHNRVDFVERLKAAGKLLEPVAKYYKDEIRLLGKELGLPENIVQKKPFPGPGLAIRCLTSPETITVMDKLDLVGKFIPKGCRYVEAKELSLKSVGVQGDSRSESRVLLIGGKIPWRRLEEISTSITNNLPGINRVTYMLKAKRELSYARIVKCEITKGRLDLLRDADLTVRKLTSKHEINKEIWQFPVILIPLQFSRGETVVLRPVSSINGMTAEFTKLPQKLAYEITEELLANPKIDSVLFDVTNKPPATIEWE